ncbi:uncharacterized protein C19orf47 isoform X2 [Phymastichus coffea]|uniref:uncharacterized protein C19orf47 isoform X2 n=1 Tax=Phymastichus coffea TaxID=108790 RepID=UPI00273C0AEB|nr:uncharacterized protein C19orf47 isoform X2 [Phymastichus coffea]
MDASLSNYWVQFFKNAGFRTDVATKHALTFTNNRIQPDMLPDLDKPSLKEMGIALMGDMIAILRYAKKIVEETSCQTFLVNSEDTPLDKNAAKPLIKKVVPKTATKTSSASKNKSEGLTKTVKSVSNTVTKPSIAIKKKVAPTIKTSKLYSDYIETKSKPKTIPVKRKYEISSDEDEERWALKEAEKRSKSNDNDVECQILLPKNTSMRNPAIVKKTIEQKKTVFHRLGDSMVSSTTSITESSNSNFNPTFTVTGVTVGKDSQKRISSVFNRLGNKDSETRESSRNSRNGVTIGTQGILKTRPSMFGTTALTTKPALKKPVGTMRADEEANRKTGSPTVKQLVRTAKSMKISEIPRNFTVKVPVHGKLASETVILPAKSRLGMSKQVTFNRTATVNHFKKPGVFSRLGV